MRIIVQPRLLCWQTRKFGEKARTGRIYRSFIMMSFRQVLASAAFLPVLLQWHSRNLLRQTPRSLVSRPRDRQPLCGAGGGAACILAQQAVRLTVTKRHGLANGYIVSLST